MILPNKMFRKTNEKDISHDYVEQRLSAYIDGKLPEAERVEVRKHLQGCDRCQSSLDTLGWTVRLLKQVPVPPLPRQFTLPVPVAKPAQTPWLKWGLGTVSAIAAVAFVFLVSVNILSERGSPAQLAAPPPVAEQHTLVAVVAPTTAPLSQDRAAIPSIPAPALPPSLEPSATSAPKPTSVPTATEKLNRALVRPTAEVQAPLSAKSALPSPTCAACGGGPSGFAAEKTETPEMFSIAGAAPAISTTTGQVKDGLLAIRASPSNRGARLGSLPRGTEIQILDRDDSGLWLQIIFPVANDQGLTGWASAQSVTLPVPVDTIPTSQPETDTPTPPSEMTFATPQPSETPTESPTIGVEASATPVPTATQSPTATSPPSPPGDANGMNEKTSAPINSPLTPTTTTKLLSPLTSVRSSHTPTEEKPVFRLGEIAALAVSIVFGMAAFLANRGR